MGKYAAYRHKIAAYETAVTDSALKAWYEKVNEFKKEFLNYAENPEDANSMYLAAAFASREKAKEDHEAQIAQLNIEIEAIGKLGVEALENEGIEKITLASGGYVRIDDRLYPRIEDKAAAIEWLLANKMQEIAKISFKGLDAKQFKALTDWAKKMKIDVGIDVDTNTLKSIAAERLLKNQKLPSWVKPTLKTTLTVVKGKNGDES